MRVLAKVTAFIPFIVPLAGSAQEDRALPPLQTVRFGYFELRPSTTKRGLASLPTTRPSPPSPPPVSGRSLGDPFQTTRPVELRDTGPEYLGTKVQGKQGLEGDAIQAQEVFAALFPKVDPCPPARTAHFDWLPHYDDYPVRNVGWHAEIVQVEPDRSGTWMVKVRLSPMLRSRALKTLFLDYVEETYRLEGEAVRLTGSDAETPKPQYQTFPLFH